MSQKLVRVVETPDASSSTEPRPAVESSASVRATGGMEASPMGEEEGQGRSSQPGPQAPWWFVQVPYFLVLATMLAGIVVVAAAYFKRGPALIASALLLAAAFRVFLPPERIGMLAVRGRWFDTATAVILAVLLVTLAWVAPQLT